ncbi:D-aminoacyl-tRNA deacylase [Azospira sp. I13]|uniref:D-aminoacyl-tRNA deacylase n=1 Tax=Azospira sp. I13 TaxID=1765050 RepID=UPI000D4F17E4|nr:D-aminoacyl-tRNA deacylase [Azospira sp. I13]GBG01635.1 D-aminoacyl-tRNA deacylase [Azospira sp. I13]
MRVVLQRVRSAAVRVEGAVVGETGPGLLLLVGVEAADGEDAEVTAAGMEWLAGKLLRLRIFSDAQGVMNRSLEETGGGILAVSQFTLFASTRKGNRPSWSRAAPPEVARPLFERFVALLESRLGRPVACGVFGADMQVELVNDGPVTLLLDSRQPE